MEYSLSESQGIVTVQLTGELDLTDEENFRTLSSEAVEKPGSKCILDLSGLQFLDSAGLGLLLVMKEFCESSGKAVSLKIGDSPVREILDISEFSSLIPYED